MPKKSNLLLRYAVLAYFSFFSLTLLAQNKTVTGKIVDENGPLAGVSVVVKNNPNIGTTTNVSGEFSLSVPSSATTLIISYVGYTDKEVAVSSGPVNVTLSKSTVDLDEVVVVGYGTQRKKVTTGSISSVRAKDLENVPNGRIEQALQGRVAGVTIMQNSGQPGSGSTIRVRGVTTFGDNNPLWVVDGVVVDAGGIGYLNQSDIESIEVLKDAASSAIYGTRAAAGVILVTTKKGRAGKLSVSYNGFYGLSQPERKMQLLDAAQYATLMNESLVAAGQPVLFPNAASLGKGTDWQSLIFNNSANRYLHEISVSGGSDKSTFYLSAGIQDQEGIVLSDISRYAKKNFRLNSNHKLSKYVTIGQTLGYTYDKSSGISTNSEFGGPLSSATNLDPITPVVITDPAIAGAAPYNSNPVYRDANGNPYGISTLVGQEMTNPIAFQQTQLGNYGWSENIVGNAYLEVTPIKELRIRSTVGAKKAYWGGISFTPVYYLSPTYNNLATNKYSKNENRIFNWNVENTVTYTKQIGDHDFTVLLGQGAYVENIGSNMSLTLSGLPITDYHDASFNFDIPQTDRQSGVSDMIEHKVTSLFARVNYAYQDKYLFTGIIRRDGSTRFGPNKKYGNFPSVTAGWNVDREKFFPANNVLQALKIRGGYGVVGNDALDNFRYLSTVVGGSNYTIGSGGITTGYAPLTLDNPNLHWESTASTDIGFDATLFKSMNLTVNWFNKKTSGILRQVLIPGYVGVSGLPWDNVADMKNSGVEVELGYRGQTAGGLSYSLNANFSYLKNTVTYVAADTNFVGGSASFQSMGTVTRTQVGHSFNEFWGYRSAGIFQNAAEVNAWKTSSGTVLQPGAQPGDFRWVDINDDGKLDDQDKVFLGSNLPKYTFGFTVNLAYKGFDLSIFGQGAAGNKIFQGIRRLDIINANYTTRALERWTGEGSTNTYPRLVSNDPNGNYSKMSDFYLENGDYLRLKVVQLGYTFPDKLLSKAGISKLRVYVTGENLLTITKYSGFDPEVGGGVYGIDKGQYPQARSILAGLQIQF